MVLRKSQSDNYWLAHFCYNLIRGEKILSSNLLQHFKNFSKILSSRRKWLVTLYICASFNCFYFLFTFSFENPKRLKCLEGIVYSTTSLISSWFFCIVNSYSLHWFARRTLPANQNPFQHRWLDIRQEKDGMMTDVHVQYIHAHLSNTIN